MKNHIISLTLILFVALMSGCATKNASQYINPYAGATKSSLEADVSVGAEISGTSSATIIMGLFSVGADTKFADGVSYSANSSGSSLPFFDSVGDIKAAATYNAITDANADVLVAPRYVVDVKNYFIFKKVKVEVTGYKGTLNGIK